MTGTTPETDALRELAQKTAEEPALTSQPEIAPARRSYLEWAVLLGLAGIMLVQLWSSVVRLSITSDEIDHLHAAYRYWQCNDFGWNPEHPPLVKIVAGLPLQVMRVNDPIQHACGLADDKASDFIIGHQFVFANSEAMLTAARFAVSLFAILLLLAVWFFARKMFGLPVAIICGVLLAFEPNLLAHGALVTTDVAAALGILLAVYALYCYELQPNFSRLLGLGLAIGFALGAKHSTVLLAVILPALMVGDALLTARRELTRRLLRRAGAFVAAGAIAMAVLWASYGFRYAARPGGATVASPPKLVLVHGALATKFVPQLERWRVAPEAYLVGLQDVLCESEVGRPAFILGKLYKEGQWFYFPVAAMIKFTLPLLLMVLLSALSWRFWRSRLRELLYLLLPIVIYFSFSMTSKLNMGVRHLLPVLPLLTIFAAAGVWNVARQKRWAMVTLVVLLSWNAISSLHAFPNYLSYSNELWGGPGETYRYLANSDDDWGQAQKMARAYVEQVHPAHCYFLRTYNNLNSDYGIPCQGMSEIQWDPLPMRYTGTMIVSSTMLDGIGVPQAAVRTSRLFKGMTPKAKLGGSALLVYEGTFDTSSMVASQLLIRANTEKENNPQQAFDLAEQALQLDPSLGLAHLIMCRSYRVFGDDVSAARECKTGLSLLRQDAEYSPEMVDYMENLITTSGLQIDSSAAGKR